MKLRFLFSTLFLSLVVFFGTSNTYADAEELNGKSFDDYTFGEIEVLLMDYLEEKNIHLEFGSQEFNEFLNDQYDNTTDQELASRDYYPLIVSYMSEYMYQLTIAEATNFKNNSLAATQFNVLGNIANTTVGELKKEIAAEEAEEAKELEMSEKTNDLMPNINLLASSYSVANAKSYAEKWWNSRNQAFDSFTADCTNFVSQILWAGGKEMKLSKPIQEFNTNTSYWYMVDQQGLGRARSSSWGLVPEFFSHWSVTQPTVTSSTKKDIISKAKEGDIIQLKDKDATRWGHSLFVYSKANSTIYLSAHSDNSLKKDFNSIGSNWTNFRVINF